MDIGNDLIGALRDRISAAGPRIAAAHPDWQGLHACCVAAHAARGVLLCDQANRPRFNRSFNREVAQWLLTGPDSSRAVNPTASADGKHLHGITATITGAHAADDRGQ